MKTFKIVLIIVSTMILTYLVTAFVIWDFNLSILDTSHRSGIVLLWIVLSFISVGVYSYYEYD